MKTVIIVGAGATVAAAPNRSKKNTPPLDLTFFKQAEAAGSEGLEGIRRYMKENHGIDILILGVSLEDVFNRIFTDIYIRESDDPPIKAMWDLLQLYNRSIAQTTNELLDNSRDGVYGLITKLLNYEDELEVVFITYNQDIMIEKALAKLKEVKSYSNRIKFSLSECYCMNFSTFRSLGRSKSKLPNDDGNSISILKLHGSLNWVYSVEKAKERNIILRQPKGDIICLTPKDIFVNLQKRKYGGTDQYYIPIIVPPVSEKTLRYSSILKDIRKLSGDHLRDAERIIVFGYSFPEADIMARNMISQAINTNNSIKDFIIIDIDPSVCTRIARHSNLPSFKYYKSVKRFSAEYRH